MRGLAAIVAAAAAWVVVTRRVPTFPLTRFRVPPLGIILLSAAVGLATAAVALGVLAVPAAAVAIGVFGAAIPIAISAEGRRRERERLSDAWPDVLAFMRARITAGATIPEAFIDAVARGPSALQSAGEEVDEAVRFGDGFASAMARLRDRLADPTADRVLATLATAHRSGGRSVSAVLATLGASVGDELRLRKAHHAALTEQRLTAAVAMVAPWLLLALTIVTNPQAAKVYRSRPGMVLIAVALTATGLGYLAAQRTARLSTTPRVFQ
jgi:tight adherence protein B